MRLLKISYNYSDDSLFQFQLIGQAVRIIHMVQFKQTGRELCKTAGIDYELFVYRLHPFGEFLPGRSMDIVRGIWMCWSKAWPKNCAI